MMDKWIQNKDAGKFGAEVAAFEAANGLVVGDEYPHPAIGARRTEFVGTDIVKDYFVSDGSAHYHRVEVCPDCGQEMTDPIAVQWAVGSTGFVCARCANSGRYGPEETSEDGLVTTRWAL